MPGYVDQVDNAFIFISVISVLMLCLITFLMFYFVAKYNRRKKVTPVDIHGNATLEILWTVIPTILVMGMFYYGYLGFRTMRTVPENAMNVEVTGRMWSWSYKYANNAESDTLYIPAGQPINLTIKSADVLHSFYIPFFRIKQDAVPGMDNYLWFQAKDPGRYQVFCAEYCGDRHAYMLSEIIALPPGEFEDWLAGATEGAPDVSSYQKTAPGQIDVSRGAELFKQKTCFACHSVDGSALVGPSLKGIFGKQEEIVTDGKTRQITVDEEYLRRSIEDPNFDVVKGFNPLMPPMQISKQEIEEIILYIKSL